MLARRFVGSFPLVAPMGGGWLCRSFSTTHTVTASQHGQKDNDDSMGHDPELFTQTVILSNGASFTRRTTSPRSLLRLTKDTRNHPLWNPTTQMQLDDESGTLTKFTKRFGELEDLNDLSFFEMEEEPVTTTNTTTTTKSSDK